MDQLTNRQVFVEVIAKKKGCILCDLAICIVEEISSELHGLNLKWEVVELWTHEGVRRYGELIKICGSKPAMPSIIINEKIAFDHIPDYESLYLAIMDAARGENCCIWMMELMALGDMRIGEALKLTTRQGIP